MAALNLEFGGRAQVTAVLRSSYNIVKERGFTINSVDHGQVRGFRPTESRLSYTVTVTYQGPADRHTQSYQMCRMSPNPASRLTTSSVPPRIPQTYLHLWLT